VALLHSPNACAGAKMSAMCKSAGPATHLRHRPKTNLNAAGFVPMRTVERTLRRVAHKAPFENGMKVALKIRPSPGGCSDVLRPASTSDLLFPG
jgi:hypothetical protein